MSNALTDDINFSTFIIKEVMILYSKINQPHKDLNRRLPQVKEKKWCKWFNTSHLILMRLAYLKWIH